MKARLVRVGPLVRPLVQQAQKKSDFKVLLPTVRESASSLSSLGGMRAYRLAGHDAVRFVYNGPTELDYWGIQQTSWTEAPILEGPTLTRRIGDHEIDRAVIESTEELEHIGVPQLSARCGQGSSRTSAAKIAWDL